MTASIKIGNAQGFWGDAPDAPARLVAQEPGLDFLTLDYLAEVSLSIMALQRHRNPEAGYAADFVEVVRSLAPLWHDGAKTRIVCNAGGLNPLGCARAVREALREAGLERLAVGMVAGDDVLGQLKENPDDPSYRNWETGAPVREVIDRLFTANAYTGAGDVRRALDLGADIVITGRTADPSLTAGACMHAFGWDSGDHDRLAAATVAGHVLECGTQACGGIATDWLDMPDPGNIGFPVIEFAEDGVFTVTKPAGAGGRVNRHTVTEQLLYEIGDPANYLSPDCRVDFTSLALEDRGNDRVEIRGVRGAPPTDAYKVSATYQDGYIASGMLTIFGRDAERKARRTGEIIFERLRRAGYAFARTNIECLGANACAPGVVPAPELLETVLRVTAADPNKAALERFAKEIAPMVTSGPQGATGYAAGRPRPRPVFAYWPCLIPRGRVEMHVDVRPAAEKES